MCIILGKCLTLFVSLLLSRRKFSHSHSHFSIMFTSFNSVFLQFLYSPQNISGITQFSVKALFSICKIHHLTHLIIIEACKKSVWKRTAAGYNTTTAHLVELAKLCHPLCGKCFLDLFSFWCSVPLIFTF